MKTILSKAVSGLVGIYRRQKAKRKILADTRQVDFNAITHEWEKGKILYDQLKKACHPDKFSGDQAREATQIFQSIMKHRYNYGELLKIKEQAIEKLKITISS